jgi:hypothetical protein
MSRLVAPRASMMHSGSSAVAEERAAGGASLFSFRQEVDGVMTAPETTPGVIEVQVDEISQLFDTLDPFPFRERDLDKDAEEYIVGWARELSNQPIEIIIHAPDSELQSEHAKHLGPALNRYFSSRCGHRSRSQ